LQPLTQTANTILSCSVAFYGRAIYPQQLSFESARNGTGISAVMHLVGRDRHNRKELKRLYDAGVREYQRCKIYDGNGEPYIERWTKDEVWEVFQDIEALPNLKEIL
jgi:hypothetical protein